MRLTERLVAFALTAWCAAPAPAAALSAELVDLAGRVEYGYYNGERRVIEAAVVALGRLADSAEVLYYRDLAALRLAQLDGGLRTAGLDACAARAPKADAKGAAAVEAWILVAACATVGGVSSRRIDGALLAARALDDDHPRLALVEAWVLRRSAGADGERLAAVTEQLERAVARFDEWRAPADGPDWGHAEALAALGEMALQRGEMRLARDLVERALLLAPDYRFADELRSRLVASRATR